MNEQLSQALATLAVQLGISVEHLWGVLVTQVPIASTFYFITMVTIAVVYVYGLIFCWKKATVIPKDQLYPEWDSEFQPLIIITGFIIGIIVIPLFLDSVKEIVTAIVNPEFMAFEYVTRLIK